MPSRWLRAPASDTVREKRCVRLGLVGVAVLLAMSAFTVPSLDALVAFDVAFIAAVLLWAKPADDIALVLLLLLSYYSLPFPVALVLKTVDLTETLVPVLEHLGLRASTDLPRYALCLLLFKCSLLATYTTASSGMPKMSWAQSSSGDVRSDLFSPVLLFLVGYALKEATGNTLFSQIVRFSGAHMAYVLVVAGRGSASRLLRFCVLTAITFLVTRSRGFMAVAALGLLGLEWQRTRRFGMRVAWVALVAFLLASAYGAYRDEGSPDSVVAAIAENSRFEVSGESGIMFQVGAHVMGLKDAALVPPEFTDSILDKLIRAIPLYPGKLSMMADRYVRYCFPAVAAGGGGFAFSGVAEAYLFGWTPGVVCYGVLLGIVCALGRRLANHASWRTVVLISCLNLVRSEFSVLLITLFWGSVWVGALHLLHVVRSCWRYARERG